MATQDCILKYTGSLGENTGYVRDGKHFLRRKPGNINQTDNMKMSAERFGMASTTAAFIRRVFNGDIDVQKDGGHINRLTTALIPSAGCNLYSLAGIRFNKATGTDRFFTRSPKLNRNGDLILPRQVASKNTLEIKVIAARIDPVNKQLDNKHVIKLTLNNGPETLVTLDVPGTGTLIVMLQVSCGAKHLAADIVGVHETGAGIKTAKVTRHIIHPSVYLPKTSLFTTYIQRE